MFSAAIRSVLSAPKSCQDLGAAVFGHRARGVRLHRRWARWLSATQLKTRDIASIISEDQVQLVSLAANANSDRTATVNAVMQVTSVEQLSRVLARLEGIRDVFSVTRDGR